MSMKQILLRGKHNFPLHLEECIFGNQETTTAPRYSSHDRITTDVNLLQGPHLSNQGLHPLQSLPPQDLHASQELSNQGLHPLRELSIEGLHSRPDLRNQDQYSYTGIEIIHGQPTVQALPSRRLHSAKVLATQAHDSPQEASQYISPPASSSSSLSSRSRLSSQLHLQDNSSLTRDPLHGGYPRYANVNSTGGHGGGGSWQSRGGYDPQGGYPTQEGYSLHGGYMQGDSYAQRSRQRENYYDRNNDDSPASPSSESQDRVNYFEDKAIRRAFIRKVYFIIMWMLLGCAAVTAFMVLHEPTTIWILAHIWVAYVGFAVYPVLMIVLICFEKARRTVPWNYIILVLITLGLSFFAGSFSCLYSIYEVLAAFLITAVLCLSLTLFAFQTKCDFTVISGFLLVGSIALLIFGIVVVIWPNKIAFIGYASLGAVLAMFYFIYDTQMLLGGNHKYTLNPEEYVFAAISLFTDMLMMFMYILSIIKLSRS